MLRFRKPSPEAIRAFLDRQEPLGLTYSFVGGTKADVPAGYTMNHTRVPLGEGREAFDVAKNLLQNWQQFPLDWVEIWPPSTPIRNGAVVAIVARSLGLWWLNACQVVYEIDAAGERIQFGFAYGTLPGHVGTGEERFLVEMQADGTVYFDILAFSRPYQWLARIGSPYMRSLQRRFGRDSAQSMQRLVREHLSALHTSSEASSSVASAPAQV
mgnify:FL=1